MSINNALLVILLIFTSIIYCEAQTTSNYPQWVKTIDSYKSSNVPYSYWPVTVESSNLLFFLTDITDTVYSEGDTIIPIKDWNNSWEKNITLSCYDTLGKRRFIRNICPSSTMGIDQMLRASDGNGFYIRGSYLNDSIFDGGHLDNSKSQCHFFIAKYDNTGTQTWLKCYSIYWCQGFSSNLSIHEFNQKLYILDANNAGINNNYYSTTEELLANYWKSTLYKLSNNGDIDSVMHIPRTQKLLIDNKGRYWTSAVLYDNFIDLDHEIADSPFVIGIDSISSKYNYYISITSDFVNYDTIYKMDFKPSYLDIMGFRELNNQVYFIRNFSTSFSCNDSLMDTLNLKINGSRLLAMTFNSNGSIEVIKTSLPNTSNYSSISAIDFVQINGKYYFIGFFNNGAQYDGYTFKYKGPTRMELDNKLNFIRERPMFFSNASDFSWFLPINEAKCYEIGTVNSHSFQIDWQYIRPSPYSSAVILSDTTELITSLVRLREVENDPIVYPNPFYESFSASLFADQSQNGRLMLLNFEGQVIRDLGIQPLYHGQNIFQFHLEGLPTGIYFVTFDTGIQRKVAKVSHVTY